MCLSTEGGLQKQTDKKKGNTKYTNILTELYIHLHTLTTSSNKRGGFSMK